MTIPHDNLGLGAPGELTWRFADAADPVRWLADVANCVAHVELRLTSTPPGRWYRLACVSPAWVQRHVVDAGSVVGLPGLLVVPPAAPEELRVRVAQALGSMAPHLLPELSLRDASSDGPAPGAPAS